jgi:hypothetical protein
MKLIQTGFLVGLVLTLVGCSTTNSNPYKASTTNVLTVQNALKPTNTKVQLGNFALANGVTEELTCRMLGPVNVAPGKNLTTFIKESFQEELFLNLHAVDKFTRDNNITYTILASKFIQKNNIMIMIIIIIIILELVS